MTNKLSELIILVRGGGEVASAIAHRLTKSGFRTCMTEIPLPLAVHRGTTFCEAIFDGEKTVEGLTAKLVKSSAEIKGLWAKGQITIIIDPGASIKRQLQPHVLVDAIMAKKNLGTRIDDAEFVIGVGPGFIAGKDVHAVIESYHNENLGKVITEGAAEPDTGIPVYIGGFAFERAIHAINDGQFKSEKKIGESICAGDIIAEVSNQPIKAEIGGILRGLLRNNIVVKKGTKLVEIDPVSPEEVCYTIRAKMRAIAGGVLEAILMTYNY